MSETSGVDTIRRIAEGYAVPDASGHINRLACAYLALVAERDTALQALAEIATHGCYHYHDPDSCLSEGEPEVCARCIAVAAAGEPQP